MALFRFRKPLNAGVVETNLLTGSKFEYLPRAAAVTVWATDDGTGRGQLDFSLGNVIVGEDIDLNNAVVAGDIKRSDDLVGTGVGAAGDRIQLRARNVDLVNAVNVNVMVEIIDL